MSGIPSWLTLSQADAPLIVSMPHTGSEIPDEYSPRFVSAWFARKDADWWIDRLYDFAGELGATVLRTAISRSVIDVNRDPSGRSLYPGHATTELCPIVSFDGETLYRENLEPDADEIARRRACFFEPYHSVLTSEIARLRKLHPKIVLFEAHSIRSIIPRLFEGELPNFNLGTNSGASCALELTAAIEKVCDDDFASPLRGGKESQRGEFTRVTNGRFKGGYTTRHYGDPSSGVHAVQLELTMRSYMHEPDSPSPDNWPSPYDPARAAPLRSILQRVLETCLTFASHT
ncbi:MAG TPA: N-formylglutamate deformylase [Rhizomicrobium sp.]|jgi:formiminoglutamase